MFAVARDKTLEKDALMVERSLRLWTVGIGLIVVVGCWIARSQHPERLTMYARAGDERSLKDGDEQLRHTFDKRLESYRDEENTTKSALLALLVLTAIGVGIIIKAPREMKIPLAEISVDTRWVAVVVPGIMMFFWLRFGFSLNEMLGHRITLVHVANRLQAWSQGSDKEVARRLIYSYGLHHTMDDGFLSDAIFVSEFGDLGQYSTRSMLTTALLSGGFSTVLALAHACMLLLVSYVSRRVDDTLRSLLFAYTVVLLTLLGASVASFHLSGGYSAAFASISVSAGLAIWTLFAFGWRGRLLDGIRKPSVRGKDPAGRTAPVSSEDGASPDGPSGSLVASDG